MSRSCRESRNVSPTGSSDSFMSDEYPEQKTIFRKPGPEVTQLTQLTYIIDSHLLILHRKIVFSILVHLPQKECKDFIDSCATSGKFLTRTSYLQYILFLFKTKKTFRKFFIMCINTYEKLTYFLSYYLNFRRPGRHCGQFLT